MFAARQIDYQNEQGQRDSISKNKEAHVNFTGNEKETNDMTVLDFHHHQ
jgi:hypothetical protein